jgi:hypothetical protein
MIHSRTSSCVRKVVIIECRTTLCRWHEPRFAVTDQLFNTPPPHNLHPCAPNADDVSPITCNIVPVCRASLCSVSHRCARYTRL